VLEYRLPTRDDSTVPPLDRAGAEHHADHLDRHAVRNYRDGNRTPAAGAGTSGPERRDKPTQMCGKERSTDLLVQPSTFRSSSLISRESIVSSEEGPKAEPSCRLLELPTGRALMSKIAAAVLPHTVFRKDSATIRSPSRRAQVEFALRAGVIISTTRSNQLDAAISRCGISAASPILGGKTRTPTTHFDPLLQRVKAVYTIGSARKN